MRPRRVARSLRCLPATAIACALMASDGAIADESLIDASKTDAYASTYVRGESEDTLITDVTVLDGNGSRLDGVDVLLADGKIVDIGHDLDAANGVQVIDGEGRWLTPGLIDVHSHNGTFSLPLTSDSLSDISEVSAPVVANTWIEHAVNTHDPAFYRALAGGVTTLQILPGSVPLIGGRSVVVKPIEASSVFDMKFPDVAYGLKMACGENPKGSFGEKGLAPTSRQGEVAMMREAWISARDYLEKSRASDSSDPEPVTRDLKLETLAGVLTGEIKVHLHCYRATDIAVMLSVAREFDFKIAAIHHAVEAYKIPDLLRDNDTCAAVWSDWWGFKMEARDAIRENAAFVDAAGACVMMHSDSPFVGQRLNLEAAKAMAAGNNAGLNIGPERAIVWITQNPARSLGLDDRIGRVAIGYNADIVIWSGNPFSIYSKAEQVFIDGALHYDRRDDNQQSYSDFDLHSGNVGARP